MGRERSLDCLCADLPDHAQRDAESDRPYLSRHFRVLTMDGRGNGRSDRPTGQAAYTFDQYYHDFALVLDTASVDRVAVVGISATAMTALRLAAEQPERVTHVIAAGGYAESVLNDPDPEARLRAQAERVGATSPGSSTISSLSASPSRIRPSRSKTRSATAGRAPASRRPVLQTAGCTRT